MNTYPSNKFKTFAEIVGRIRNWPTAVGLRLYKKRKGLRLLEFKKGLTIILRGGTRDWDVVHELFFANSYEKAMKWLAALKDKEPTVIDLGGNIGLFSLKTSQTHPGAKITAFEPGPPNSRIFRMNLLANGGLDGRIFLREQAVAGTDGEAVWHFDIDNPGGSSLYGDNGGGEGVKVTILAFDRVVDEHPGDIALVKIDIEGAEYDLLEHTAPTTWNRIHAIAIELHGDPSGKKSPELFLEEMKKYGYRIEQESVCSYFLQRDHVE